MGLISLDCVDLKTMVHPLRLMFEMGFINYAQAICIGHLGSRKTTSDISNSKRTRNDRSTAAKRMLSHKQQSVV
jgi:hypothetical protein